MKANKMMKKAVFAALAVAVTLITAPVFTQEATAAATPVANHAESSSGLAIMGIAIGAALVVFGASFGIGKIGGSAVEGMSRQPEAAGKIQTAMIIAAALIEGIGLFAVVLGFLLMGKL